MIQEFTVFSLDDAVFGLDVSNVREVLRAASLSDAPGRDDLEGFLNLRGAVIPVIDVRARLKLQSRAVNANDFLVVIQGDSRIAALRTDASVRLEQVDSAAVELSESATTNSSLIAGTIRLAEKVVSLLSISELLKEAGQVDAQ